MRTFWFRCVKSAQILTESDNLDTTTILVHLVDGSSTDEMMPVVCIRSSSSSTFFHNGMGTLRAVCSAYGTAPCLNLIVYSFPRVPKPLGKIV